MTKHLVPAGQVLHHLLFEIVWAVGDVRETTNTVTDDHLAARSCAHSCGSTGLRHVSYPRGRTWSKSYIARVPQHPICKNGWLSDEEKVTKAANEMQWILYQGFRPRALFYRAPVFPVVTSRRPVQGARPMVVSVFGSENGHAATTFLGVNVTCETCMQSGAPDLIPAILPRRLLKGRSFLEVAALDGQRCFWAEESGATDVVCIDYHGWGGMEDANTHGMRWQDAANSSISFGNTGVYGNISLEAFQFTRCLTRSRVKALRINVYDLSSDVLESAVGKRVFDVVYAGGLIYHLKHPVLGFEALSSITSGVLLFETEVLKPPVGASEEWHSQNVRTYDGRVPEGYQAALCRWFREGELLGDTTNFWSCTLEAYASMLRSAGFTFVHDIGVELFPGLRREAWRDRRVLAAAKNRQGDLRIIHSFGFERVRL